MSMYRRWPVRSATHSSGQYSAPNAFQMAMFGSSATGYGTFRRCTAAVTLPRSCSNWNSGEWIPITTSPSGT